MKWSFWGREITFHTARGYKRHFLRPRTWIVPHTHRFKGALSFGNEGRNEEGFLDPFYLSFSFSLLRLAVCGLVERATTTTLCSSSYSRSPGGPKLPSSTKGAYLLLSLSLKFSVSFSLSSSLEDRVQCIYCMICCLLRRRNISCSTRTAQHVTSTMLFLARWPD